MAAIASIQAARNFSTCADPYGSYRPYLPLRASRRNAEADADAAAATDGDDAQMGARDGAPGWRGAPGLGARGAQAEPSSRTAQ